MPPNLHAEGVVSNANEFSKLILKGSK